MSILCVADLHQTASPQDLYRQDIWRQMVEAGRKHGCSTAVLGGDLTNAKDNHPAKLVNAIVSGIHFIANFFNPVVILPGNHDGISKESPFFEFTKYIQGVEYIKNPTEFDDPNIDTKWLFLPHTRTPEEDWKDLSFKNKLVFAHLTLNGAIAENGMKLESNVGVERFKDAKLAVSGDIHHHQEIGDNFVYVGAPYSIKFGDNFDGGYLVIDSNAKWWKRDFFDFPRRQTYEVEFADEFRRKLKKQVKSDTAQIKIVQRITQDTLETWKTEKQKIFEIAEKHGAKILKHALSPEYKRLVGSINRENQQTLTFDAYCKQQQLDDDVIHLAKEIINETDQAAIA